MPVVWIAHRFFLYRMPTNHLFHATSQPFSVLNLIQGTGQLGLGLYVHQGFVTSWDRVILEIHPTQPLEDVQNVSAYSWKYLLSTGHYLLMIIFPQNTWTHIILSRYIWSYDRIAAPEFAYPGRFRQIRLANSPRNQQWLETADIKWIQRTVEGIIPLSDSLPIFAWKTKTNRSISQEELHL